MVVGFRKMLNKSFLFVALLSIFFFYACGGKNAALHEIFSEDDREEQALIGIFESRDGRLSSSSPCFVNESCKELCESMLRNLEDKEECYEYQEDEVQGFRDTYNLLAVGDSRKLEQITTSEMEKFLIFGPQFWQDAIKGFKTGIRNTEACDQEIAQDLDSRECRRDTYYIQKGYDKQGAANALSWIASNNWLAELVRDYDKERGNEHSIMKALLDVISSGEGRVECSTYSNAEDCLTCLIDPATPSGCFDTCSHNVCSACQSACGLANVNNADLKNKARYNIFSYQCLGRFNYCEMAYCEKAKAALRLGDEFYRSESTGISNVCDILLQGLL